MEQQQQSFSRLWDGYETDKDARAARDCKARSLRKEGRMVKCWALRNQCRKYAGLGQPDGRSCTVYMLDILSCKVF